jgi:hypothetical protein
MKMLRKISSDTRNLHRIPAENERHSKSKGCLDFKRKDILMLAVENGQVWGCFSV